MMMMIMITTNIILISIALKLGGSEPIPNDLSTLKASDWELSYFCHHTHVPAINLTLCPTLPWGIGANI